MARKNSRRGNGPVPTQFGRLPMGPMGPRPRPVSWAAGMAPFGRTQLSLSPAISGGQISAPATIARRAVPGRGGPSFTLPTNVGTTA